MPEACAAADELDAAGIAADVVCLTSADSSSGRCGRARASPRATTAILDALFPAERAAPIVTVLDGHPHTLAFLAGDQRHAARRLLGVDDFGQSGDVDDLYRHFGIDTETIVGAAIDLID